MSRRPFRRKDRPGWAVKWGERAQHQRHFLTKKKADDFADEQAMLREQRQLAKTGVPTEMLFGEYAKTWLKRVAATTKRRTLEQYAWALEGYLLPALGERALGDIARAEVKDLVAGLRQRKSRRGKKPLSKKSVALVWGTLRTCLESAKDDELIPSNPAEKLGRRLRLHPTRGEKGAKVRAFDAAQLARFQDAAEEALSVRDELQFRTMAGTGMRPGEAAALAWDDLDLEAATALVRRTADDEEESGASDETKTGPERTVDLGPGLVERLRAWDVETKAAALKKGKGPRSRWVFASHQGRPSDLSNMRKGFQRALAKAGLPSSFTPHSLRHTYASLMLAHGEPLAYVAEQLGHADIRLTVHLYGRWLRKRAPGAVERLEAMVSKKSTEVR